MGDPGISEGLSLVIDGIKGDVLGGMDQLQAGISGSVIPGFEEMNKGVKEELQPGFTKVSVLLLVIRLVSLVIFLAVGILSGRNRKGKISAAKRFDVTLSDLTGKSRGTVPRLFF